RGGDGLEGRLDAGHAGPVRKDDGARARDAGEHAADRATQQRHAQEAREDADRGPPGATVEVPLRDPRAGVAEDQLRVGATEDEAEQVGDLLESDVAAPAQRGLVLPDPRLDDL